MLHMRSDVELLVCVRDEETGEGEGGRGEGKEIMISNPHSSIIPQ